MAIFTRSRPCVEYTPLYASTYVILTIRRSVFALATLSLACGGDPSGPVQQPVAASLQAATAVAMTGAVGGAASAIPTVRVLSSTGAAVSGVPVTFTAASGSGSVGRTTATSAADGTAAAGSWTLGTTAGAQTVRAEAAGLATVLFTATVASGTMTQLVASAGSSQTALTGAAVATRPSVVARDAFGNPVPGVAVTFEADAGNGTVTGPSATTDASGAATVGSWTLSVVPGAHTLRARSGAITATIAATANLPTGCTVAAYALGAAIPATWSAGDCTSPGGRGIFDPAGALYDQYEFTTAAQAQFRASVTGTADRSLRIKRKDTGAYVAQMAGTAFNPSNSAGTLFLEYVLAAGTYIIEVQAPSAGATGSYTLTTQLDSTVGCTPAVFGTPNITINDTISSATDCLFMGGYEDRLIMVLPTGINLRFTLTSAEMSPFLVFRDDRLAELSPTLRTARATQPGAVTFDWTTTFSGYYEVIMTTLNAATGQKYTLTIQQLP